MHGWLVVMYSCLKSISMQGWTETQRPEDGGRWNDRAAACKGGRKTARYSKLIVGGGGHHKHCGRGRTLCVVSWTLIPRPPT